MQGQGQGLTSLLSSRNTERFEASNVCTQYHSYHEQHHQALTAPTVYSKSANHVRLGGRGRRHHFKEMDQGDQLLDCLLWTKMSYSLSDAACAAPSPLLHLTSFCSLFWRMTRKIIGEQNMLSFFRLDLTQCEQVF